MINFVMCILTQFLQMKKLCNTLMLHFFNTIFKFKKENAKNLIYRCESDILEFDYCV